ncbi:unnamed protein product [Paramecium sonneborni]|uniref:WD40-repeat-containing domain n=1 Tax=Paramecium sonneborni TaxID=65129 RepID=A0A8S1M4N4_9CILI|nr:unnamed protein product [Paramecium sonneborni]
MNTQNNVCDDADYQQIMDLEHKQSKEVELIINKLNILIEQINHKFSQIKQDFEQKFKVRQEYLKQMDKKQIYQYSQSIMNFQEQQQKILKQMEYGFNNLVETLNVSKKDFSQYDITNMVCFPKKSLKPFKYELINSVLELQGAFAFSFSQQSQFLVGGYNSGIIKIFEFDKGQIKLIQEIQETKTPICCVSFMNQSTQFISRGDPYTIILWQQDSKNGWICKQKLQGHSSFINCLRINQEDDLIISGSNDKSIKLWRIKNEQWQCSQTINCNQNKIISLSINDSSNQIISCGSENQIIIIQQQCDLEWKIIQIIQLNNSGFRLSYINDDIFVFQGNSKEKMNVYERDLQNKQFKLTKEVNVKNSNNCQYYFPQQFIKQKSILVNKNGRFINLLRVNSNGDFINEQVLEFDHEFIFGSMTEDGEYLIIYDDQQKKVQIRKYQD